MAFEDFFDSHQFNYEDEKKKLLDNMDYIKTLSVEENTFYRKYSEIQEYRNSINKSSIVKAKIWNPSDIEDESKTIKEITDLKPRVIPVFDTDPELSEIWLLLRVFVHTMPFDHNIGRFLKFLVIDDNSGKYLGFISLASDVVAIGERDTYLGWSLDDKLKGKLNNSAIASCIAPTQPFGFNFIGGKLIALLSTSSVVRKTWQDTYKDVLAGVTTTSLYGPESMYNGLPNYKSHGVTQGKIFSKPDDSIYQTWHHWLQENRLEDYNKTVNKKEVGKGPITGIKQKILNMIFKEVGIKSSDYYHSFNRGIYYSCIYENTKEFFQNKVGIDDLKVKPKYVDDSTFIEWWRNKAINRYKKLLTEKRLDKEILFYNRMIGMNYEKSKSVFFKNVGR